VYLAVVAIEGISFSRFSVREKIIAAFLWQAPAWFFALVNWFQISDLAGYSIFILQLWYTPLVGLLSIPGLPVLDGRPLYYYLTLLMPILMSGYYFLFTQIHVPSGD